ncbi:MAG: glycyl-radical enzyme activating protein [Eubacteriales bacterium]|nr:glycyl-radical enzyme activating protein [Eubacteriales bacterium]
MLGSVFDVEEFAVYDGPGIRSVVFLKGCPLHCSWCHNPEGLDFGCQRITSRNLCMHCGACDAVCPSPKHCTGCGKCAEICPADCIHIAGKPVDAELIAKRVLQNAALLKMNGGGVTFSGGEPLAQPDFVLELRGWMKELHACIESSGYASAAVFQRVMSAMDFIIMDVKLVNSEKHRRYTGVDNQLILSNLQWLKSSDKPFRIRIPLIPTVNDDWDNMTATAKLLLGAHNLEKVELLPYHQTAGAKYESAGRVYLPNFPVATPPHIITEPFTKLGMEVTVL